MSIRTKGFIKFMNWIGAVWMENKKTKDVLFMCHRCKKPIERSQAFIVVKGEIVMYDPNITPNIFTCPESAYNYAQKLILHSTCWIDILKEYGVELFDMKKVLEEYRKKKEVKINGLGQEQSF